MRYFLCVLAVLLPSVYATDPAYQEALDQALKEYPPGDYDDRPVRRFHQNVTSGWTAQSPNTQGVFELELLQPVDPSDKDVKTLFSEAASYFTEGRWDLAMKRYKQSLLLEPANTEAKAHLFDILILRCLYETGSRHSTFAEKYEDLKKRLSKDIIPKAEK